MKLLVIEDEKELLETIARGLSIEGYYVDMASNGHEAIELLSCEEYDVIILDLNLPDMSGFDVLNIIGEYDAPPKVLILTANSDIDSKVRGFNMGASDYIVKPFDFKELDVRVKSLLRRRFSTQKRMVLCGDLAFDTTKRLLSARGKVITLTKKETAIIEYLMLNQNRIVSSEDLLSHAWDSNADLFSNSIRVHLTTLRKKIKAVLGYNPIVNKVGEGYFLES